MSKNKSSLTNFDECSPFFILGNPRSGTSMFRMMLNSHPEMVVPPECGFLEWLHSDFSDFAPETKGYEQFAKSVCASKKFETWEIEYSQLLETLFEYSPQNYRELCLCVYLSYAKKLRKRVVRVGDKNNYYMKRLNVLDDRFPLSKKIFILRDGRDVACSYLKLNEVKRTSEYYPNLSSNIREIAEEWRKNAESAAAYEKSGALVVKYEDLLSQANVVLKEVCSYLSIYYSESMLDFAQNNDEPVSFLQWKGKTTLDIQSDNKGNYKTVLSDTECAEFEDVAGEMLKFHGYMS